VEKNFTSSVDREENERLSFGGSATPLEATVLRLKLRYLATIWERKCHWNGTLCFGKLQDTGGRETHGCSGLTVSKKLPACVWRY